MPFKIVRNDITKMNTEAIVNTANDHPTVGTGCDHAVYQAAGYEELLSYRQQNIGYVKEGDVFLTPGFRLPARYIIHAVSPLYIDGSHREEELLRSCYRKSLALAAREGIRSVAFPLIATGGFGYPKEEGMRIAVDEIHAFLLKSDMQIFLVVFDEKAARMGKNLYPDLETYIDLNYVEEKHAEEYGWTVSAAPALPQEAPSFSQEEPSLQEPVPDELSSAQMSPRPYPGNTGALPSFHKLAGRSEAAGRAETRREEGRREEARAKARPAEKSSAEEKERIPDTDAAIEEIERKLGERIAHMTDTFPQYLFYLIRRKGMKNSDVYKRAIVDKKVFSKIKNNPEYHPQKLTALRLCIGAMLDLDETKDLLARAGYALSPCDKTDIIFSYFIENRIYDMIEVDIQLEEHGQPCVIT